MIDSSLFASSSQDSASHCLAQQSVAAPSSRLGHLHAKLKRELPSRKRQMHCRLCCYKKSCSPQLVSDGPSRRNLLLVSLVGPLMQIPKPATAYLVEEEVTDIVFQRAAPSVVGVINKREQGGVVSQDSEASGFVWDSRGYIVTNYHCIQPVLNDRAGSMYTVVRIDNLGKEEEYRASFRATDASHDLAVLQIDAPPELLTPIRVGRSADLRVGQSVFSIGSPYGFSKTFTAGVVSGLNRGVPSPAGTIVTGAVQTDASISSGNSGGPLLDSAGRLIGISTATYNSNKSMGRGSGVNFAVSVDTLMKLVPNMIVYANASGKGV